MSNTPVVRPLKKTTAGAIKKTAKLASTPIPLPADTAAQQVRRTRKTGLSRI